MPAAIIVGARSSSWRLSGAHTRDMPVVACASDRHQEANVRRIDRPIQVLLFAAFISMMFSIYLWFFEDKDAGVFVGLWVPSILAFGALIRSPR